MRQAAACGRQPVLLLPCHLAKCTRVSIRQEHGIVAETLLASRGPYQRAGDAGVEFLHMPVGPCEAECRHEMRSARRRRMCSSFAHFLFDQLHGAREVPVLAGPASGKDAGGSTERVNCKTGIVGKGSHAGGDRCADCLMAGISAKGRSALLRSGQVKLCRRNGFDPIRQKQLAHFRKLSRIVGGDHQRSGNLPADRRARVGGACRGTLAHITAIFCRSTSFISPFFASASRARNCSSVKGTFSAVPCISTNRPAPVMTKLASVSAPESSA